MTHTLSSTQKQKMQEIDALLERAKQDMKEATSIIEQMERCFSLLRHTQASHPSTSRSPHILH